MRSVKRLALALMVLIVSVLPQQLLACAVCFGDKNSQAGKAADAGVLTLLLIVMAVLAAIATFFIYIIRRGSRPEGHNLPDTISTVSQ